MAYQPFGELEKDGFIAALKISAYALFSVLVYFLVNLIFRMKIESASNKWKQTFGQVIVKYVVIFKGIHIAFIAHHMVLSGRQNFYIETLGIIGIVIGSASIITILISIVITFFIQIYFGYSVYYETYTNQTPKDLNSKSSSGNDNRLDISKIGYVRSKGNYVILHFKGDNVRIKKEKKRSTLHAYATQLNNRFIQTHRSYIINIAMVELIKTKNSTFQIKLKPLFGNVPVSRNFVKQVQSKLGK